MLCFLTLLAAISLAAAGPSSNVFQIDITPEEAQKYLNSPPFTDPQLAGRTAVLPLIPYNDPRYRTAEAGPTLGHYWKNGHEIENPDDYVEEVYNAAQYHGQDGLGAYAYGYETPQSAKVENRVRSGDVTGSYIYKDGKNDLIKVRYWADHDGFHQEDNLPKVVLKQVEEAPDVREARLAHEKAWKEAAAAAAQQPDPQYTLKALPKDYYQQTLKALPSDYYQPQASEQQASVVAAPSQYANPQTSQAREGKAYFDQSSYQYQTSTTTEPEPTGPPRGFFYSFTYPASSIVLKNEAGVTPGYPVNNNNYNI